MTNTLKRCSIVSMLLIAAISLIGCDYGRMYDQDSIKTYKQKAEPIDERAMPLADDGLAALRLSMPQDLKNPMPRTRETAERGRLAYGYFCVHCHGPNLDGMGTVGISFSPLPANLRSPAVLSQEDGTIYEKIRLGFGRHPRLFSTIDQEDAWSVVVYLKSLDEK